MICAFCKKQFSLSLGLFIKETWSIPNLQWEVQNITSLGYALQVPRNLDKKSITNKSSSKNDDDDDAI